MKHAKIVYVVAMVFMCSIIGSLSAQTKPFTMMAGPRLGVTYTLVDSAEYNENIKEYFGNGPYYPVNSAFLVSIEQRLALGESGHSLAVQELLGIGGLEQGIGLPSATCLVGFRHAGGMEFGIGPILTVEGWAVAVGLGYVFDLSGVEVPLDISVVLPNQSSPSTIMISTGFNFDITDLR